MNAIRIHQAGGPEVLHYETVDTPEPGFGQVRVRLRAAGVNHRDIWLRSGQFGGFPNPIIPGSDGAGEIDAIGPSAGGVELGQRVVINPGLSCGSCPDCLVGDQPSCADFRIFDGAYAEYAVVPASNVAAMPSSLTFTEAASIGIPFVTAEEFLTRSSLLPGQSLLLWGASGGLGLATIQLAKLRAVRVIAVTRNQAKADQLRQVRADDVIVWDGKRDITDEVKALTHGRGCDLVVDSLGQATFAQSLAAARRGGAVVTVGSTTGAVVQIHLGEIFRRRITVFGAYMGKTAILPRLLPLFSRGYLMPVIDSTYPLEQAAQAHAHMERGDFFGKIVLEI